MWENRRFRQISKALRHIEYLGETGASRNILLRVDGDGFGRIKVFKVPRGMIYKQEKIDKKNII